MPNTKRKGPRCVYCLLQMTPGLSIEERNVVETAYNSGAVSVLCCTSTMAVGVNLPARRVVFYKPYIGLRDNPIDVAQ